MKYPNIEALGIEVQGDQKVWAVDLETALDAAPLVTGYKTDGEWIWGTEQTELDKKYDTHVAKIIGTKKIKKGVKIKELQDVIAAGIPIAADGFGITLARDKVEKVFNLLKRLESEGIINE